MSTASLRLNDPLLPPPVRGLGPGASLALVVHAALLGALALGVQWRARAPEVISAELWAAVPQVAAPKVEAPPPPPAAPTPPAPQPTPPPPPVRRAPAPEPDAQMALERAREQKLREQREQREREQREQREREQRDQKAAETRTAQELERRREENLRRMLGQAAGGASAPATSTGSATADAAPSRGYAGRLVAAIKPNIVFPGARPDSPPAEVEVRATATGAILARRLIKSSGHREWDEAVLRAIDRTERLPADVDGRVPSTLVIAFRPQEAR